jgi:hypothetical protein
LPPTIIDSSRHQKRFLAAFSACASVIQAARWAKINRQCHYNWLREDPTYPQRFKDATEAASRTLEDEAVRRAHEGLRKPVRYKGKIVGYETEFSDSLLIEVLRANSAKFRPAQRIQHEGASEGGAPVKIIVEYEDRPAKATATTPRAE